MNRHAVIFWLIIGLAVWGIVNVVLVGDWGSLSSLLIPVILFAVVFLMYKYQPNRSRNKSPKIKPSARTMAKTVTTHKQQATKKRKDYPFHVIEGQKGKNDDDVPKYH